MIWSSSITPQERQKQLQEVRHEAERIKKCNHPSIVEVYESFEENNTAYMIMAFVEGKTLAKILKEQGFLQEDRVKRYFIQIAEALQVIHANQILHRDIKPDNILINDRNLPILRSSRACQLP